MQGQGGMVNSIYPVMGIMVAIAVGATVLAGAGGSYLDRVISERDCSLAAGITHRDMEHATQAQQEEMSELVEWCARSGFEPHG